MKVMHRFRKSVVFDNLHRVSMGIPTATKIAIIATSRNVLAHARIDNSSFYNFFFNLKNNKRIKT